MTKITKKKIAEIAAASRRICHPEGLGHGIAVFPDGSWMLAISSNDGIARGAFGGGWEYRLAYVAHPMTRAQVEEMIRDSEMQYQS